MFNSPRAQPSLRSKFLSSVDGACPAMAVTPAEKCDQRQARRSSNKQGARYLASRLLIHMTNDKQERGSSRQSGCRDTWAACPHVDPHRRGARETRLWFGIVFDDVRGFPLTFHCRTAHCTVNTAACFRSSSATARRTRAASSAFFA